ncbi:MAG TPA: RNA polymerase sigma factor [Candidatus Wallbacteria bacterium]|nr:RNA polymerase sigma factor [Candidatus Wallbacteria bacterium]
MGNDLNLSNWFGEFHKDLFRFLVKLTGDWHESEDILQDAYVRANLKFSLFDPGRGSLKNWVYKIAINIYYDRERFKTKEMTAVSEYYAELLRESGPDEIINFEYSKEMMDAAIAKLASDKRALFLLSLKNTISDMADIFSIAEGTVKSRLHYIRKELVSNLKKLNEGEKI